MLSAHCSEALEAARALEQVGHGRAVDFIGQSVWPEVERLLLSDAMRSIFALGIAAPIQRAYVATQNFSDSLSAFCATASASAQLREKVALLSKRWNLNVRLHPRV